MDGLEDNYAIAIVSYALTLAQHPAGRVAFNLLETKADSNGELLFDLAMN